MTAENTEKNNYREWLTKIIDKVPESDKIPNFNDFCEARRYVPPGLSPYPGPHRRTTVPHFQKILDLLHPDSPIRWIAIMKSVQSSATYHAECAIAAYIEHQIGSIGFYTATQDLARARSSGNIDPLIDSCGLEKKIRPISERNVRKRADSMSYKEFMGGLRMIINSYGAISSMKSHTLNLMILDEIDEAPDEIGDQGDILGILEGRTIALRDYKILAMSTPSRMETSKIYRLYMQGDQQHYFVPCPICGEMQTLHFGFGSERTGGLTFEHEKNNGRYIIIPETVGYTCEICGKFFRESHKQKMLEDGKWSPTTVPVSPDRASFHVSGLYSPSMFLSWDRLADLLCQTEMGKNLLRYKDYRIKYMGLPWGRVESSADWEKFKEKADDYILGDLPSGALLLYGGVDVQQDRLELAVIGLNYGMEIWLVDYRVFHGKTDSSLPWDALVNFVTKAKYDYAGRIALTAVDTGYDPRNNRYRRKDWAAKGQSVYSFCARHPEFFIPTRGADNKMGESVKRVRIQAAGISARYDVNTAQFKEILYNNIELGSGPHAVHFPAWQTGADGKTYALDDHFYKSMISERYQETRPGVMQWRTIYDRNEVLDTVIYAMAAAHTQGIHIQEPDFFEKYEIELTA